MNITQLQLYGYYNLNTLVPSILGGIRQNVMLEAIIGYDIAVKYDNVDLKTRTLVPSLPTGTPSDPRKYTYLLLKNSQGVREVLAWEWIDPSSVVLSDVVRIQVTIPIATASDTTKIRDALTMMGFMDFDIQTL